DSRSGARDSRGRKRERNPHLRHLPRSGGYGDPREAPGQANTRDAGEGFAAGRCRRSRAVGSEVAGQGRGTRNATPAHVFVKTVTLPSGREVPALGLGTWKM